MDPLRICHPYGRIPRSGFSLREQNYVYTFVTNVRTNLRLHECTYESTLIRMYVRIFAYTNVHTNLRVYECTYVAQQSSVGGDCLEAQPGPAGRRFQQTAIQLRTYTYSYIRTFVHLHIRTIVHSSIQT